MTTHDPTTFADLSQGRISHIDCHIRVDFSTHTLDIEATYQMQGPVHGSLYLDSFKIEMEEAHTNGRRLDWETGASDPVLGERLHLKGLEGEQNFTLKIPLWQTGETDYGSEGLKGLGDARSPTGGNRTQPNSRRFTARFRHAGASV